MTRYARAAHRRPWLCLFGVIGISIILTIATVASKMLKFTSTGSYVSACSLCH